MRKMLKNPFVLTLFMWSVLLILTILYSFLFGSIIVVPKEWLVHFLSGFITGGAYVLFWKENMKDTLRCKISIYYGLSFTGIYLFLLSMMIANFYDETAVAALNAEFFVVFILLTLLYGVISYFGLLLGGKLVARFFRNKN
ncbi:hypothetical protein HZA38_01510 [Candidatus Peregrinibacteria bacterium]|nr:hypothetical protein [Candidatus Peregrinibacteria bacterium]